MTTLPVDVAAGVHQIAEQLHQVLRVEMVREHPSAEVALLWQAAKLINTAVGGLDYSTVDGDEHQQRTSRWVDVAEIASDITDAALGIAAAEMTLAQAARQVEKSDVDIVDLRFAPAAAFAGTIEVTRNPGDLDALTADVLSVKVAGNEGRALTVTSRDNPTPSQATHTPATLLRTAHHLQRLGATLGAAIDDGRGDAVPPTSRRSGT